MGTLTAAAVKDRYQKLAWYKTSDKKLYKTTEDGTDSDTAITDLTLTGELTVGSESSLYSLTIKRYGSSLAGDSNPFTISHELGDGAHDLTLFGSTSDTLHLRMLDGDIKLGPSTTPNTLLTNAGAATIGTTLTVGTIAEVGSDTDKFLMSDSGVVKYATGANVRSYIGAGTSSVSTLNDLSNVTYSLGDLTITGLDKIISGALTFDNSGDITFDMESNVMFIKNNGGDNPMLAFDQEADNALGPLVDLRNSKDGGNGDNNDLCGTFIFNGQDDAGNPAEAAKIDTQLTDVSAGSEKGRLGLYVATYSGYPIKGLDLQGTSTAARVDVTIASGATSLTTINGVTLLSKTAYFTAQTGTDAVSIDWTAGNKYHLDLDNSSTVTFATNPTGPCNLILKVTQPAAGSKVITYAVTSGTIYWTGGGTLNTDEPTLTTAGDTVDILSFYFDGTNYYGAALPNFVA